MSNEINSGNIDRHELLSLMAMKTRQLLLADAEKELGSEDVPKIGNHCHYNESGEEILFLDLADNGTVIMRVRFDLPSQEELTKYKAIADERDDATLSQVREMLSDIFPGTPVNMVELETGEGAS